MTDQSKWLGLMKWSMKYTDGTAPSSMSAMSEEDKAFLEKVMREGVMDETERMEQILRILGGADPRKVFQKDTEDDEAAVEASDEQLAEYKDALLDELLTRADQIDNAMNFVKLKGLPVLRMLMQENPRGSTRALAAEVCSVVVQNNPFAQQAAVEAEMLPALCALAQDTDVLCQVKALLAISCLVRNCATAEAQFLSSKCDGVSLVLRALRTSDDLRVKRKALFFLRYLVRTSSETATRVQQEGTYLPTILPLIHHADMDLCESSLEAFTEFLQRGGECAAACRATDLALVATLEKRLEQIRAMDDSDEEKEFLQEVVRLATHLVNLVQQH